MMKQDAIYWAALLEACGVKTAQTQVWAPIFSAVMVDGAFSAGKAELDDFLGQVLHESGMLVSMEECLSYSAERIRELGMASPSGSRWRSLVFRADKLARNPVAFANACYGERLGNIAPGDGFKYRGSSLIQVTGKDNFAFLEKVTGIELVDNPDLLRRPGPEALRVCIAWWEGRVPDAVMGDPVRVTKAVNGGTNGLADRIALTIKARAALA